MREASTKSGASHSSSPLAWPKRYDNFITLPGNQHIPPMGKQKCPSSKKYLFLSLVSGPRFSFPGRYISTESTELLTNWQVWLQWVNVDLPSMECSALPSATEFFVSWVKWKKSTSPSSVKTLLPLGNCTPKTSNCYTFKNRPLGFPGMKIFSCYRKIIPWLVEKIMLSFSSPRLHKA